MRKTIRYGEIMSIRTKGSYILILRISEKVEITVGKLGNIQFEAGFYGYIGSAMNGLEARIKRHLGKEKKNFWHIDYLLERSEILKIIIVKSEKRIECELAKRFSQHFQVVKKFGSSDCKCRGHLICFGSKIPSNLVGYIPDRLDKVTFFPLTHLLCE